MLMAMSELLTRLLMGRLRFDVKLLSHLQNMLGQHKLLQAAGRLSHKSGKKAAGLPDGPNVLSGLAAPAPSVADQQPCIDQGAGSDDGEEASKCIICWTTDRETTLAPCGHRVLCRYFYTALCAFGTAVFRTRNEC